MTSEAWLVTYV